MMKKRTKHTRQKMLKNKRKSNTNTEEQRGQVIMNGNGGLNGNAMFRIWVFKKWQMY